jgi:hypothetical protein
MSKPEMKPGEQRSHSHPKAGAFLVRRWFGDDHPKRRPFFCAGRFYASEEAAVLGFFAACEEPPRAEDRSYARAEASFGEEP